MFKRCTKSLDQHFSSALDFLHFKVNPGADSILEAQSECRRMSHLVTKSKRSAHPYTEKWGSQCEARALVRSTIWNPIRRRARECIMKKYPARGCLEGRGSAWAPVGPSGPSRIQTGGRETLIRGGRGEDKIPAVRTCLGSKVRTNGR